MKNKSVKGILSLFVSKIFPPLINFAVFTFSARILAPEDFGVVALALSIVFIASSFTPIGWRTAIIKFQLNDNLSISSVLWFNLAFAALLVFILYTFTLSNLFEFQTELFNNALIILSIRLFFDVSFYTLNNVLLTQQKFTLIAIRTVLSTVVSAAVIVFMLINDYGIWALIWSQVLFSISNFLAVLLPTWKLISFKFSFKAIKKMSHFALYSTYSDGATTALDQYDSVVIGSILGTRDLGFYNVAKRLNRIINEVLIGTVSEVSFPILANKLKEREEFLKVYFNVTYLSVACLFPILAFLFISSHDLFLLLFGEKWLSAAIVFQAFCIVFCFIILNIPQKNVIILNDHAKWWFYLQLKLSLLVIPFSTVAAGLGLKYFLAVLVIGKFLYFYFSLLKSCKLLAISIHSYLSIFIKPFISCFFLFIAWLYIYPLCLFFDVLFIDITVTGLIFVLSYICILFCFDFKNITSMIKQLKK